MLIQGSALKKGARRSAEQGAFLGWLFRSSLAVLSAGLSSSLLLAVLTWIALRLGGADALSRLTGAPEHAGSGPPAELLAGWSLTFFSSQLTPVALAGASPAGLAFGLGSPLVLAAVLAVAFRAGAELEGVAGGRGALLVRAAALALPQALACGLLFTASRVGSGPVAGAPPAGLAVLPAVLVGAASVGGALWRRERRLGGTAAAGARGIAVAALSLLLAAAAAGLFGTLALVAGLVSRQVPLPGGLGTLLLGVLYLPNIAFLSVSAGLGGGPPLAVAVEPVLCVLVVAGCLLGALHLNSRPDRVERAFFAAGFPLLVLLAALDSRPLVSSHTLGFTPGTAFWVAAVVAVVTAAAGPHLAGHRLLARAVALRPLAGLAERLPDLAPPRTAAAPRTRRLRLALPRHGEAGALGTAVLLITGVVMLAMIVLVGLAPADEPPSLQDAAAAYLRAESSGPASSLWSTVSVDRSALPAGASSVLLSEYGLEAMRRLDQNRAGAPAGIRVLSSSQAGQRALLSVAYSEGGVRRSRDLVLVRESGAWKVRLEPALLAVAAAPGLGGITVDGTPLPGSAPVAVLPGFHRVASSGTVLWQPAALMVQADDAAPALTPVALHPALSNAALASAIRAVEASFTACAGLTSAAPSGCPQSIPAPAGSAVSWKLVGDPSAGAAYSAVDDADVVAAGHFQMIGAFAVHLPEGVRHLPSSGGFNLPLHWDGAAFKAGRPVAAAGVTPAIRPALGDASLLGAVAGGFQACLASDKLRPADCPQSVPSTLFITGVRWTQDADPLSGAAVSFDPTAAVFHVSGAYSMHVSYEAGGRPAISTSSGRYRADLFWDGATPVLVQIADAS